MQPSRATALLARFAGLGLLALLAACAQQREPGYYDTPRGNTVSDARHRAQGNQSTVAPSQIRVDIGSSRREEAQDAPTSPPSSATESSATEGAQSLPVDTADAAGAREHDSERHGATERTLPGALSGTRTYLGTVACMQATGACPATRMTLTLAPDGQWRARSAPVDDAEAAQTRLGCWVQAGDDPVRIVLQAGDHSWATFEFAQSNVLRLVRLDGRSPLLESRLTRQADIDPIDELKAPAQDCPSPVS